LSSSGAQVSIPAELKFLIACCQHNFRSSVAGAMPSLVGGDWARFALLASFHRVEGLAYNALASISGELVASASNALSEAARAIAAKNLRSAAECKRILANFRARQTPVLFLKGLPVGALAYRDPFLKSALDTDILIDAADIDIAADLLHAAGYRLATPQKIPLAAWHERSKESVWMKESEGFQLDLHTRTSDNPRLIPSIDVHSAKQWVRVAPGIQLPTLASDELIAYLMVHGASSAWFRLKWISDLAALLHGCNRNEIERLYVRTYALGAGRSAGQALILADRLFGALAGCDDLRNELLNDVPTRRLALIALRLLTREPLEPTQLLLGTVPIHYSQMFMLPGLSFKFAELSAQARRFFTRVRT
jgi:hypothetical protein